MKFTKHMIWHTRECPQFVGKMLDCKEHYYQVEVLAVVGLWAMVRRKGLIPIVVGVKELSQIEKGKTYET